MLTFCYLVAVIRLGVECYSDNTDMFVDNCLLLVQPPWLNYCLSIHVIYDIFSYAWHGAALMPYLCNNNVKVAQLARYEMSDSC